MDARGRKVELLLSSSVLTSSVAALLVGGGAPAAWAACGHNIGAAFDNPAAQTTACVAVTNTSFTGNITNEGTVAPGGIVFNNGTITGSIVSTGTIAGGINLDGKSAISSTGTAIAINGGAFSGGISNSGTISVAGTGVLAAGIQVGGNAFTGASVTVSSFAGGISNSGSISVNGGFATAAVGIQVGGVAGGTGTSTTVSSFSGGISNGGMISVGAGTNAPSAAGIEVRGIASGTSATRVTVSSFGGGITNRGTIAVAGGDAFVAGGILVGGIAIGSASVTISRFDGGIINNGTIAVVGGNALSAAGIAVGGPGLGSSASVAISSFGGGISNNGTITVTTAPGFSSAAAGIVVAASAISNFSGGISNNGSITVADSNGVPSGTGIVVNSGTLSTFAGGITNSGTISAATGVAVVGISTFLGNISNSGKITAANTGIFVCNCVSLAGGAIVNTGTITAATGILVHNFSAVSVFDSGTITSTGGAGGTAIDLTQASGSNTVTLGPGYSITGKVLGAGTDTLQLGGSGSGTFDLGTVGATQQYQGFTTFNVDERHLDGVEQLRPSASVERQRRCAGRHRHAAGDQRQQRRHARARHRRDAGHRDDGHRQSQLPERGELSRQYRPGHGIARQCGRHGYARRWRAGIPGAWQLQRQDHLRHSRSAEHQRQVHRLHQHQCAGLRRHPHHHADRGALEPDRDAGHGRRAQRQPAERRQHDQQLLQQWRHLAGRLLPSLYARRRQSGECALLVLRRGRSRRRQGRIAADDRVPRAYARPKPRRPRRERRAQHVRARARGQPAARHCARLCACAQDRAPAGPEGVAGGTALGLRLDLLGGELRRLQPDQRRCRCWHARCDCAYVAGGDNRITPDTVVGFALGGGGTNWGLAQGLGGGRSDAFMVGVHGTTHLGAAYVAGALGFANHWFSTTRAALGDQLSASFNGQSFGARLEAGYRHAVPAASLPSAASGGGFGATPYAALQTQSFHTPSYNETDLSGGSLALGFADKSATDTRSELGARFEDLTALNGMPLLLRARLAWAHDWVSSPVLSAAFQALPGPSFTVNGAAVPADSVLTTAAAELAITPAWSLSGKFDGEFARGAQTYAGTGTVRYRW